MTWPSLHRALAALRALTLAVLTLGAVSLIAFGIVVAVVVTALAARKVRAAVGASGRASQPRERHWDKPGRTVEGAVEYFVTMTTHVPDGTSEQTVEDVKAREAAHSADLAAQGHLLRLWRPPLRPGEWRTFGLFAASDDDELERVLASMPLRIWRTDAISRLSPHTNDPGTPGRGPLAHEFLIGMTVSVPAGTPDATVAEARRREAERTHELAVQGRLMRLWEISAGPGAGSAVGVWSADDPREMQAVLESLPLYGWITAATTPLSAHPSDPALTGRTA